MYSSIVFMSFMLSNRVQLFLSIINFEFIIEFDFCRSWQDHGEKEEEGRSASQLGDQPGL